MVTNGVLTTDSLIEFLPSRFYFSKPKFLFEQKASHETNAAVWNPPCLTLPSCSPPAETSKVDYVLFQAATAVMESVVREWILLEKTSIESLRAFLLTYVLQRPK